METIIEPKAVFFQEDDKIPNNSLLPALIYKHVLDIKTANKERIFKRHFEKSGWRGGWTGVIYDFHHFHPNSHEALAIAKGRVEVLLGGENGKVFNLEAGDLIILPAGTGHKMISQSESLVVVGAYPPGQENFEICKSITECPEAKERIVKVELPANDPFYSTPHPLISIWKK